MINIKKVSFMTLLVLSLSSCNVYTKFHGNPNYEKTDSLYNYINASNDTANIATIGWKEFFIDPHLQTLIEKGLLGNTDLNVAQLNIDQADIALKTARLSFLPSLGLSVNGNVNSVSTSSFTVSASTSWELDFFGKLHNAKQQKKASLLKSVAYQQYVKTKLISTIANSYYSLLMLDSQLDISRKTIVAWDENIRTMEALKNAGRVNQTSVLQSKANRVALQSKIVSIEKDIAQLENSISALLMSVPDHIERGKLDDVVFPEKLSVGMPFQLLSNRPDVKVAEYNLQQAFYETNIARSSLYPSVTIGGTAGYSDGTGSILKPGEMLYSAVASLVQPIFSRGTLSSQLKISKLKQEQALMQFNQSLTDAAVEVNKSMIQLQSAGKRIVYDKEQIGLLSKAVNDSELLMKHGRANYLEVLTSQISLLQAELSHSTNLYDEIQGVISLYRSVGGGRN